LKPKKDGAHEVVDPDTPPPLGKQPVKCTAFMDANLYHCQLSGRAAAGILHFFNSTPVDWFSKKQSTVVQTATFGSEFVAARTATDQIITNRSALRYLGVEVKGTTILYGDNRSVIDNSTIPHSRLNKRHIALSYHRVREALCAGIMDFLWIDSKNNPADILSKHWSRQAISDMLHSLLFMPSSRDGLRTDPPA
jgi:hypothetical protein